jgi:hypothetical protein
MTREGLVYLWGRLSAARAGALAGAGALALCWPGTAPAAPLWLPPQNLGSSVEKQADPDVAVNRAGRAVAVFERFDGRAHVIRAAVRTTAYGDWRTSTISPPGEAFNPQVTIDRAGNMVAIWQRFEGQRQVIQALVRPARSAAWRGLTTISGTDSFNAELAGNEAGTAVAVWHRSVAGRFVVQSARRRGGRWSQAQDLSGATESGVAHRVAIDEAGNAVVVWQSGTGAAAVIRAAVSVAGGAWSAGQTLSAGGASAPDVDVGPGGQAVVVWQRAVPGDTVVEAASWRVGSPPGAARALSAPGVRAGEAEVALGPGGRAVAVWRALLDGRGTIQVSVRPAGGAFGAATALSPPRMESSSARVDLDPAGNAVVLWLRSDGTNDILQSATRPAGSTRWLPVQNVSRPGGSAFDPQIVLPGGGRGITVLMRSAGANWVWQVADYLAAPPARGLVSRAYVAAFRRGPAATRLSGRRDQMWAYFVFLVQPARSRAITVTWYAPGGRLVGTAGKARSQVIESSVVGRGGTFQRGVWRAVLRVGGRTVAQARVRVG